MNKKEFWMQEIEGALDLLLVRIEEVIELYPEAKRVTLSDFRSKYAADSDMITPGTKTDPDEVDLQLLMIGRYFKFEDLYQAGQEEGFKTVRSTYLGFASAFSRLEKSSESEEVVIEKLKNLYLRVNNAEADVFTFGNQLKEILGKETD